MTVLRQISQIVLVVLAFWAALSIDADNGQRFLVDAARGGALSRELLGALALIIAGLGVGRFLWRMDRRRAGSGTAASGGAPSSALALRH